MQIQGINFDLTTFAPMMKQLMLWTGVGLGIIIFMALGWWCYYLWTFKYKGIEIPLYASGGQNDFAAGKRRNQKFRFKDKAKTTWQPLWPLFNSQEIQPFDEKFIYPGNQVIAFKIGERYIPGELDITKEENQRITTKINPVPSYVRKWESITYKQYAQELTKQGFWEENKHMIMTVVTVIVCLLACIATIWLILKAVGPVRGDLSSLTSALNNIGNIPAK